MDKMRRLLERGGIFMKDPDLGDEGGTGGGAGGSGDDGGDQGTGDSGADGGDNKGSDGDAGAGDDGGDDDNDDGEGKKLSDTERELLKESMGRKKQIKELREQNTGLSGELDTVKGELASIKEVLGDVDLEAVSGLLKAQSDAETKALEDKGEYERIIESVKEKHAKVVSDLEDRIANLEKSEQGLLGQIDEMTVGRSFGESSYIKEKSTLPASIARREFGSHFEMKDGVLVGYDKPAGTEGRTPFVDAEGNFESFEVAIEQLYTAHPDSKTLIKSAMKSGSGAKPDAETETSKGDKEESSQSSVSKIAAGLAKL